MGQSRNRLGMSWHSALSRVLLLFLAQMCLKARIVESLPWSNTSLWPALGHRLPHLKSCVCLVRYRPEIYCRLCSSSTSTKSKPTTVIRNARWSLSTIWPGSKSRHPP